MQMTISPLIRWIRQHGSSEIAPLHFFCIMLATTVALLGMACALPDDRYLRYQALTEKAVVKVGWIYERIHFDPAPIDVVFIGTSHTVFGIDSKKVEQACRDAGGDNCASIN